jgi:hypothetical protein
MHGTSREPAPVRRVAGWETFLFAIPVAFCVWLLLSGGITWEIDGRRVFSARRLSNPALALLGLVGVRCLISPGWRVRITAWAAKQSDRVEDYRGTHGRAPLGLALVIVGAPVLLVYLLNDRLPTGGDAVAIRQTAASLVFEHNCNIDEYVDDANPPYQAVRIDDHWYSAFPPEAGFIFLAPVLKLGSLINPAFDDESVILLEKLTASAVASGACVAMFLALLRVVPGWPAWWLTMLLALGTGLWTTGSHLISQHGPVCLLVATVLWLALWNPDDTWSAVVCGLCCGLAVVIRPTAAIFAVCYGMWLLLRRRRAFAWYAATAILAIAPFLAFHQAVYHHVLGAYRTTASSAQWAGALRETVPANLLSPARGLFIWTPLAVLAFGALAAEGRRGIAVGLSGAVAAWVTMHLLVVGKYTHWWGGHSYGPRFMIDVMPGIVLLAAPTFARYWKRGRPARAALLVLIGWSVFTQVAGAFGGAFDWVRDPVNVDLAPARIWDFRDPPFFYDFLRTGPPPSSV